jgi:hypothetical protein
MHNRLRRTAIAAAALLAAAGCRAHDAPARERSAREEAAATAAATATAQCEVLEKGRSLIDGLEESSGLAHSRIRRGIYWTHNDSGNDADLFAITAEGRLLGRVRVEGARNRDWEDIAAAACPAGDGECLYLADTGDNARGGRGGKAHDTQFTVRLVVLREPDPRARAVGALEYEAIVPGERTDIEALAVLPDGRIYMVSKGIGHDVELFRWPTPLRLGAPVTLERVRRLAPEAAQIGDRVTGASASPDGRWVAVRTYAGLAFYHTADLVGTGEPVSQLDLESLAEPQGEAVSLANDGTVVLTSEGPGHHLPGTIARLRCALPR